MKTNQLELPEEFKEVMEIIYDEILIMALEEKSFSELTYALENEGTVIGISIEQLCKINSEKAKIIKDAISCAIKNNIANEWGDILEELESLLIVEDEIVEENSDEVSCNYMLINTINKIYEENCVHNSLLQTIFSNEKNNLFEQLYAFCPKDKKECMYQDIMKLSILLRYMKKSEEYELDTGDIKAIRKNISDWLQAVRNVRECFSE